MNDEAPETPLASTGNGGSPGPGSPSQRLASGILAAALIALALFILWDFRGALVWAAILAIASWPLYRRFTGQYTGPGPSIVPPLLFTLAIGLIFVIPLVAATIELQREIRLLIALVGESERTGLPAPDWLAQMPIVGSTLASWWHSNLGDPEAATELLGRMKGGILSESTRAVGLKLLHGVTLFGFTLLTLFFIYRSGAVIGRQILTLGDRLLGQRSERLALTAIAAVHGTVNGLVLVGLGEGILLGIGYGVAGVPHPALFGAFSCVLAIIPFGAPVVIALAALTLLGAGSMTATIGLAIYGTVLVFAADHFVRPVLIGGAVRLPFLWVLLGILGGLESLGFLGLFVGPAVMAVLISLWREWTSETAAQHD
jgi:predicted PurR-regulated permease PerM